MKIKHRHCLFVILMVLSLAHTAWSAEFAQINAHTSIVTPEGEGPFPVVMMIPGCGGFSPSGRVSQQKWAAMGFMSMRIDLIAANEVANCRELSTDIAIKNSVDAIRRLSQLPRVKTDAITLLGISWGGAVAMAAAAKRLPVAAIVLLYPACRFTRHLPAQAIALPTLVIHGEADLIAPLKACRTKFSKFERLRLLTFAGAPHGFLGWNQFESETRQARNEYQAFFRR
ncbi:MAG: dienelactone hydrolase family protein [Burkholderiaceae bacterium]